MNSICFKSYRSSYSAYPNPYLEIHIDGHPLDSYLDRYVPNFQVKGLVSPFDGWLINESDRVLLWQRVLPDENCRHVLPVLICPDDQDFTCTVIVTEIYSSGNSVFWKGLGSGQCDGILSPAEWADRNFILEFDRKEYVKEFSRFGLQFK